MENNVLLKHSVVAEGVLARTKHVYAAQFHMTKKVFAKRAKVRTVAKTPRRNADKLPTGS
jgi:hypothetical protein